MECADCGGYVEWKGPLSNLTHTECALCGAINNQVVESFELSHVDDEEDQHHG